MQENKQTSASQEIEEKKNYTPLILVAVAVIVIFMVLVFVKMNQNNSLEGVKKVTELGNEVSPSADLSVRDAEAQVYLFTSEGCPHCRNVKAFLETNSELYETVGLQERNLDDVATQDERNQQVLDYGRLCGFDKTQIGAIPLLYIDDQNLPANERCLVGDTPIITYLQAQKVQE